MFLFVLKGIHGIFILFGVKEAQEWIAVHNKGELTFVLPFECVQREQEIECGPQLYFCAFRLSED
jgi:hypothetical protein